MKLDTIAEIHRQYDSGATTPNDVVERYIERIEASKLNAFLTKTTDLARAQAREATLILKSFGKTPKETHPLFGIPVGYKDALTTEGVRTTSGSKILEHYIPPYSATVVRKMNAHGALTMGKLNMDEFAMGSSNENSAYGHVVHPTHAGYVPGGSSGGSAAAVKAGLCIGTLGSDTGGSIRLPAHYCGIPGLKPTYGRVSRYGLIAFASSLDQIGPFAPSVSDLGSILSSISGRDPRDSTSSDEGVPDYLEEIQRPLNFKGLRIGLPKEYQSSGIQPEVKQAMDRALEFYKSQGAQTVEVDLPNSKYSVSVYYIIAVSEASSNLGRMDGVRFGVRAPQTDSAKDLESFYSETRALFGSEVKRRIILGTYALSAGYYDAYYRKACQVRRLIQQDFTKAFQKCDVIFGPVSPTTAFKVGEKSSDPLTMYLNDLYTIPVNLAGLPALSLPCGEDSKGLPIGGHFIGKPFQEGFLLNVAKAYEKFQMERSG